MKYLKPLDKARGKQKNGYTLLIVLVVMSILLTIAYFYSEGLFTDLIIARNNKGAAAAFSLAEAGVQEAIYKIQYDTDAKEKFMNSTDGLTTFEHDPVLISNGSYTASIQNNAKHSAVITATGFYKIGLGRTAQRQVKVSVAQAPPLPPYPYDGGVYTIGKSGESNADIDIWYAALRIYNGSLLSNRDINLKFGAWSQIEKTVEAGRNVDVSTFSTLKCNCLIAGSPLCSSSPSCAPQENAEEKIIPAVDFEYLKQQAKITPGHYYAKQKDFKDALLPAWHDTTLTGTYYVDDSLDIDQGRTLHLNGVIATSGSINISLGQLFINPPAADEASGAFTQRDFKVGALGNFGGVGLMYAADRVQFDTTIPYQINLTGGIISRRTWLTGFRTVNIYFDPDIINNALIIPTNSPVIEINHWEEEY